MNLFSLNITDVIDILYVSICEPVLHSWGIISFLDKTFESLSTITTSLLSIFALKHTVVEAIIFTLKFIFLIALLVFIRGGIPRYRYDFLTKIGWIKFLSLVLAVFLSSLLLVLVL